MSNKDSKSQIPSKPRKLVSNPLKLDVNKLDKKFYRADIEFHGIHHFGPSYEGRVFINNPEANDNTSTTLENGYVGSYHIFGHGPCYGDEGHCEVTQQISPYDWRPSHHLSPAFKRIRVTDQIKKLGEKTDEFVISIVPILAPGSEVASEYSVMLEKISIVTYNS